MLLPILDATFGLTLAVPGVLDCLHLLCHTTIRNSTHTKHSHTTLTQNTHTQHSHTKMIHNTHAQHSHTTLTHNTHTQHSHATLTQHSHNTHTHTHNNHTHTHNSHTLPVSAPRNHQKDGSCWPLRWYWLWWGHRGHWPRNGRDQVPKGQLEI